MGKDRVNIRWMRSRVKDGKVYASLRWTERDPVHGTTRRLQTALGYVTEEEARFAADEQEARLLLGLPQAALKPQDCDVALVLGEYLADTKMRLPERQAELVEYQVGHLARHLGTLLPDRLTTAHLRTYIARRRRELTRYGEPPRKSTLLKELACLRTAMRHARDIGLILAEMPSIPRKAVPDDTRPRRRLTEGEVRAIINAAGEKRGELADLITVLAWSGRRPIAVFSACVEDARRVDETGEMYWRRDKGGVGRGWGPLTAPAKEAILRTLEHAGQGEDLLWPTRTGAAYSPPKFHHIWKHTLKLAKVEDVQLYDLRRFACTEIVRATPSLEVAAQFTGHRETRTLLRYLYAGEDEALQMASEIGWSPTDLREAEEG